MSARRSRDVVGLLVGVSGFAITAAMATRGGVDDRERRAFRAANDVTGLDYRAIWVPMQYGTFATAPALAGLAFVRRRPRLGVELMAGGTAAYILAKVAKGSVGRGRPANELEDVAIRGKEEGDLGFPSGHAAVSAALTTVAAPFVPAPVTVLASALAGFVSFARVHVGAHLPLDVIGGASLGVAVGSAAHLAFGGRDRSAWGRSSAPG